MPDIDHDHPPYRSGHYEEGAAKPPGENGEAPRHQSEPEGSEGSSKTSKTRTDPHTGEPTEGRPDTAG